MIRSLRRIAAVAAGSCVAFTTAYGSDSLKAFPSPIRAPIDTSAFASCSGARCEADADDTVGFEARIRAAASHPALFDRLASERDSRGRPVSVSRDDFLRARLFCHMLPTGSLSGIPDATSPQFSQATRTVLGAIGDPDNGGRVSWAEYLALSALLAMPDSQLRLVLSACDDDDSGRLSRSELDRAIAFILHEEARRVAPTGSLHATRWRPVKLLDPESLSIPEKGEIPGSLEVPAPLCLCRAAGVPGSGGPHEPDGVARFVQGLRDAVVELEFAVFADALGEGEGAPTTADQRMSPAAFVSYLLCQSDSGPEEMASLLAAWGAVAAPRGSAAGGDTGGRSRSRRGRGRGARSRSDAASLDLEQFRAARRALVDRSDDVVAALRLLARADEARGRGAAGAVGPEDLRSAVAAVSGEPLPVAVARCLLVVLAAREAMRGRMGPGGGEGEAEEHALALAAEAMAEQGRVPLSSVERLLAAHAGQRVGVKKRALTVHEAFQACMEAE